uniref:hypothetical protein n=1 Tax=Bacillus cytotoxicus TaxID=580165 RepID=UPI00203B8EBD
MFKQEEEESSRLLFVWKGGDLCVQKSSWIYINKQCEPPFFRFSERVGQPIAMDFDFKFLKN